MGAKCSNRDQLEALFLEHFQQKSLVQLGPLVITYTSAGMLAYFLVDQQNLE